MYRDGMSQDRSRSRGKKRDTDVQRRPPHQAKYVVTEEIREGLRSILVEPGQPRDGRMTTEELSERYLERYAYQAHPSTWTSMKNGTVKVSALAFHLAEMMGWERPPLVHADPDIGEGASQLEELKHDYPELYEAQRAEMSDALKWGRRLKKSKP